jgi:hypothetical protein
MHGCIHRHRLCANRQPTPFISMTTNIETARRYVKRRAKQGKKNIKIVLIHGPTLTSHTTVYHTRTLFKALNSSVPYYPLETEYWALHEIPSATIHNVIPYHEFKMLFPDFYPKRTSTPLTAPPAPPVPSNPPITNIPTLPPNYPAALTIYLLWCNSNALAATNQALALCLSNFRSSLPFPFGPQ